MFNLLRQSPKLLVKCTEFVPNSNINSTHLLKNLLSPSKTHLVRFSSSEFRMAKALVIVADGTEEMEAVITADVLRRGKVATTIAGLEGVNAVKCSCGTKIVPDVSLDEAVKNEYDAVILPGGLEGSNAFGASAKVGELLKKQEAAGKYCAAICAAPTAFKKHGIGAGKTVTSYPSMADQFKGTDYKYTEDQEVVVDGKLVTSRGPGTAFAFGLKLVELLVDKKTSDEIKAGMLVK